MDFVRICVSKNLVETVCLQFERRVDTGGQTRKADRYSEGRSSTLRLANSVAARLSARMLLLSMIANVYIGL